MDKRYIAQLKALRACSSAVEWAQTQKTRQSAWDNCDRADWMLWLLERSCEYGSKQHRKLILVACRIAASAQRYVTQPQRAITLRAIRLARRWTRGLASIKEVQAAGDSAWEALWDAAQAVPEAKAAARVAWAAAEDTREAWAVAMEATIGAMDWGAAKLRLYADWVRVEFPHPPRIITK